MALTIENSPEKLQKSDELNDLISEKKKFEDERRIFIEEKQKLREENKRLKEEQKKILQNQAIEKIALKQDQIKNNNENIGKEKITKESARNQRISRERDANPEQLSQGNTKVHHLGKDAPRELRKAKKGKKSKRRREKNAEEIDLPIKEEIPISEIDNTPPVLGPKVTNGTRPLFGIKHTGGDAIMALACKYPKQFYERFVGSLRQAGYPGDIVLAVSPPSQMKPGVEKYLKAKNVVAYGFDVDCKGSDNCKLKDEFLGYPDPRPYRTFANIRYALYEYWLTFYSAQSYILILDFRDTFFQRDPFAELGPVKRRPVIHDLRLFAENWKVKTIGKCVYNSMWLGRCFGQEQLEPIKDNAVICSGSTLGSKPGIHHYIRTMLAAMDRVKCWLKNIESDQGYQNYLYYNGFFHTAAGNATLFHQGNGVVNTIGAMNGFRVPAHMKGPLDTHWKIRDKEGFILNNDGERSACVHQWDRFFEELHVFVDSKLYK